MNSRSLHRVDTKTLTHSQIDLQSRGIEPMILRIAFAVRQMLMHLKFGAHQGAGRQRNARIVTVQTTHVKSADFVTLW
jgi:hypothetical protein